MKHIWTVACSRAVIDKDSNNVSLQNVLEALSIKEAPKPQGVLPIELDVVTFWTRESILYPEVGYSQLRFMSPSGKTLCQFDTKVDLTEFERSRTKVIFQGLPLYEEGIYTFRVDHKKTKDGRWRKVAEIPLKVNFISDLPRV